MEKQKPLIAITGANSGIGKAAAIKFSKKRYPLLLMDKNIDQMEALHLPHSIYKKVDVRHAEEIKSAVHSAEQEFGPLDCLINNAGVAELGNFVLQSPEQWREMLEVNVIGILNGLHAVIHKMVERKKGTIINTGSISGKIALAGSAVYTGSKFAVHAITETIRQEVAKDNVRLILIAPGLTETGIVNPEPGISKQQIDQMRKQTGKFLPPKIIANAIWFAYKQPKYVNLREMVLAPLKQH